MRPAVPGGPEVGQERMLGQMLLGRGLGANRIMATRPALAGRLSAAGPLYGPGCRLRTPGAAAWGGEVTPRGRTNSTV